MERLPPSDCLFEWSVCPEAQHCVKPKLDIRSVQPIEYLPVQLYGTCLSRGPVPRRSGACAPGAIQPKLGPAVLPWVGLFDQVPTAEERDNPNMPATTGSETRP